MKLIFKKSIFIFKLNQLKEESNLSFNELSRRLDISKSTIAGYCTGANLPDLTNLKKLARYFKVTLCELTGGVIR